MAFIFSRPQDEIIPLETLVRIRREALIRTKERLDANNAQLKATNKRLDKLLDLLQRQALPHGHGYQPIASKYKGEPNPPPREP